MSQLAEQLSQFSGDGLPPDRYNAQFQVTVNYQQQQRGGMLPLGDSSLKDVRVAIGQLGRDLRQRTEAHPMAVRQVGLMAAAAAYGGYFVTLENIGTEPASVFFGSGKLSLMDRASIVRWQDSLASTVGFTDQAGDSLDGISAPALIQPRSVAKAYIQSAVPLLPQGQNIVQLEGQIELPTGPDGFRMQVQPSPAQFIVRSEPG